MKPSLEVIDNELQHTNIELQELRKELEDLKAWRRSCSLWAAGWAGICAAVMSIAGFLNLYWEKLNSIVEKLR